MIRLKVLSTVLAISLVILSSFSKDNGGASAIYNFKWFTYNGYGDPNSPVNYNMVMFAPGCNSNMYLCAIFAECDFWSWQPTSESLFELGLSSSHFTQPYIGPYGQVKMHGLE